MAVLRRTSPEESSAAEPSAKSPQAILPPATAAPVAATPVAPAPVIAAAPAPTAAPVPTPAAASDAARSGRWRRSVLRPQSRQAFASGAGEAAASAADRAVFLPPRSAPRTSPLRPAARRGRDRPRRSARQRRLVAAAENAGQESLTPLHGGFSSGSIVPSAQPPGTGLVRGSFGHSGRANGPGPKWPAR